MWNFAFIIVVTVSQVAADSPTADPARQKRLDEMKEIVDRTTLTIMYTPPQKLERLERPVLRYTNPLTDSFEEGALFLWVRGKRPYAAVSPSFRGPITYWELSSLSDFPLELHRDGAIVWQPPACSRPSEMLKDAPAPAQSAAGRLTQMRALARRFQVREERRGQWQDARLLSQPVYRWDDTESGVMDGALFGYAETTDPELLLLLEARSDLNSDKPAWYFAIAKMTSSPTKVSLDEQEIWSASGYWRNPRTKKDPYVEAQIKTATTAQK